MALSIAELAQRLGCDYRGDGARTVARVSGWEEAEGDSLVFRERSKISARPADAPTPACLIAPAELVPDGWNAILSDRPKIDFARAAALLVPRPEGSGVRHPTAAVAPAARIGERVDLGAYVTVGAGAEIDGGSILHAGVSIGEGCRVGARSILHPGVVLYPGAEIGSRVVLHAGVVVGSDGFGYVFDGREQVKFPQAGRVVIEDDVEIGANTTIDRGSLGVTRIGAGTKIDNLVQIAHNVRIGRAVVIAAQTGISGSTVIEDQAVIGGQVGFGDHARVCRGAVIGSKAGVLPGKIVRGGQVYWGVPVRPLGEYKRLNALFGRLPEMKEAIDALRKAVDEIRESLARTRGSAR